MSLDGLYVAVEAEDIKLNDQLTVGLSTADSSEKFEIPARVVRVRKNSFGRTTALGLEVDFDDDDEEASGIWMRHVETLKNVE